MTKMLILKKKNFVLKSRKTRRNNNNGKIKKLQKQIIILKLRINFSAEYHKTKIYRKIAIIIFGALISEGSSPTVFFFPFLIGRSDVLFCHY